jgi:hypothetical protein
MPSQLAPMVVFLRAEGEIYEFPRRWERYLDFYLWVEDQEWPPKRPGAFKRVRFHDGDWVPVAGGRRGSGSAAIEDIPREELLAAIRRGAWSTVMRSGHETSGFDSWMLGSLCLAASGLRNEASRERVLAAWAKARKPVNRKSFALEAAELLRDTPLVHSSGVRTGLAVAGMALLVMGFDHKVRWGNSGSFDNKVLLQWMVATSEAAGQRRVFAEAMTMIRVRHRRRRKLLALMDALGV